MILHQNGITRIVLLVWCFAIKTPRINYGLDMFLQGILANRQEELWSKSDRRLCPVEYSFFWGLVIVMKRAKPFNGHIPEGWFNANITNLRLPGERKDDSFGFVDHRLVVIDYGN